jgi:hypothetical protein
MDKLNVITLKPSRIAVYLRAIVFLLSVIALWLCGLDVAFKILLTVMLSALSVWDYCQQKQLPLAVIDVEQIELVDEQLVLPWLIVLSFRVNTPGEKNGGKKITLALWPDMAHADELRRLRVFLRNR